MRVVEVGEAGETEVLRATVTRRLEEAEEAHHAAATATRELAAAKAATKAVRWGGYPAG
jgi:hypothetical protein